MNPVNPNNTLSVMLDKAFGKVDRNKDGVLDAAEYKSFYEVLKAGIAVDEHGTPKISDSEYFARMDHNADGGVDRGEMQTTGVLMPAELTDASLEAMIEHLRSQTSASALLAARYLSEDDALSQIPSST